jgi:excisionase family DNA binding protein
MAETVIMQYGVIHTCPDYGRARDVKRTERMTISVEEAGKKLGISRGKAYEAAHRGDIPIIRIGSRLLVPKAAFDKMLSGEKVSSGAHR